MENIKVGMRVRVPCDVKPGPFSSERLVTFETTEGPISGFVREQDLLEEASSWYVSGIVLETKDDSITVKVRGSFFTTNGLAKVARERAMAA